MSVQPEIRTAKKEKENKEQIKTRTNLFRFFVSQRSGKGFVSFSVFPTLPFDIAITYS